MTPRDYALLAQEAYTAPPDIGIADSASRAIVRQTDVGLCIAFPGTDNFASWCTDLDILTVQVPGVGEVHDGFWRAWQAIEVDVVSAIGGCPVTLVGHSLGAALAILAAASLTLAGNPPVVVYGFEPPRISSGSGLANLLAVVPLHLYKNGNDLVPDVPPELDHAGPLVQIGTALLPFPNAKDHAMERVILAL